VTGNVNWPFHLSELELSQSATKVVKNPFLLIVGLHRMMLRWDYFSEWKFRRFGSADKRFRFVLVFGIMVREPGVLDAG